ncbi:MAG: cyclic nucleotide-binding domain-containing protein [Terriglobales bacterium]
MNNVGNRCQTLLAPARLRTALAGIGTSERFCCQSVLFHAGQKNAGVFLICAGKVSLEVPGIPQLSRTFSAGSVLGLPSSFSERPYSLTAVSETDSEVVHVSKKKFLDLMKAEPDLCREATDILSREVTFIMSALRGQRSSVASETEAASATNSVRRRVANG